MSILSKLASALNRKDEVPNQDLAKQLATKGDKKAIQELVDNLNNKNKAIQSDCIKVLYEIGERKPQLIAEHVKEFIS
jgi:HEAT repeat protein